MSSTTAEPVTSKVSGPVIDTKPKRLEVENLGCVRGDRRLFKELSFSLSPAGIVQLTGPNGSGKTSLLRIIAGLLSPEEGIVRWRGENIRSLGEEYYSELTYVGHRHGVKEELTSLENLRIAGGLSGRPVSKAEAGRMLERVGLGGRMNLAARLLSEGQRRRSALARLVGCGTTLWLLDEVLASLDSGAIGLMKELIEEHLDKGGMAIIATHQEFVLKASSFQHIDLAT